MCPMDFSKIPTYGIITITYFRIEDNDNAYVGDSTKTFVVISALEEAFSEVWLPVFLEEGAKQVSCHREWNGSMTLQMLE